MPEDAPEVLVASPLVWPASRMTPERQLAGALAATAGAALDDRARLRAAYRARFVLFAGAGAALAFVAIVLLLPGPRGAIPGVWIPGAAVAAGALALLGAAAREARALAKVGREPFEVTSLGFFSARLAVHPHRESGVYVEGPGLEPTTFTIPSLDPAAAVAAARALPPHVDTVEMEVGALDGLRALRDLFATAPRQVVEVRLLTPRRPESGQLLAAAAKDGRWVSGSPAAAGASIADGLVAAEARLRREEESVAEIGRRIASLEAEAEVFLERHSGRSRRDLREADRTPVPLVLPAIEAGAELAAAVQLGDTFEAVLSQRRAAVAGKLRDLATQEASARSVVDEAARRLQGAWERQARGLDAEYSRALGVTFSYHLPKLRDGERDLAAAKAEIEKIDAAIATISNVVEAKATEVRANEDKLKDTVARAGKAAGSAEFADLEKERRTLEDAGGRLRQEMDDSRQHLRKLETEHARLARDAADHAGVVEFHLGALREASRLMAERSAVTARDAERRRASLATEIRETETRIGRASAAKRSEFLDAVREVDDFRADMTEQLPVVTPFSINAAEVAEVAPSRSASVLATMLLHERGAAVASASALTSRAAREHIGLIHRLLQAAESARMPAGGLPAGAGAIEVPLVVVAFRAGRERRRVVYAPGRIEFNEGGFASRLSVTPRHSELQAWVEAVPQDALSKLAVQPDPAELEAAFASLAKAKRLDAWLAGRLGRAAREAVRPPPPPPSPEPPEDAQSETIPDASPP